MLVSVIVPSYNHSRYVLQTLRSVLNQTWKDVELIVIDDGSTDGSAQLIRDFHNQNPGFTFVSRENRGLIHTLAEGLSLARGEYFCEIASDDYFPEDSIAKRAGFLNDHPECVAVFGDGHLMRGESLTNEMILDDRRRTMFDSSDPIPLMLAGTFPVFSTGLFRLSLFQDLGGFDANTFRYYEDLEPPLQLALAGPIGYLNEPVIVRRDHDTNVSKTTQHIRAEKVLCFRKLLQDKKFARYHGQIRHRLIREYLALCRYLKQAGKGSEREIGLLNGVWPFVWRDPRLLWYLLTLRSLG